MKRLLTLTALFILTICTYAQPKSGEHQPFSSYWFIDELLEWDFATDEHAKFNVSNVPLQERFVDASTQLRPELSTDPSIISLIAPYTTNNHPSQGFQSVEEYAFPYWQYIDYMVQWGGSAGEGIIVTPTTFWMEAAHLNGVQILGTVFFPPIVYGGKKEWVREFLQKDEQGNFPVADKLLEVAQLYGFEGWFINQETNGMGKAEADAMQEFLVYYHNKGKGKYKLMWYDAMIEDGRVIWQDEFNHHNSLYFQNGDQRLSDIMFVDFGWSETQLEDSHKRAHDLGRSPWEIYSGINVQGQSYKAPANWDGLYKDEKPYTTSIGLYWPNATIEISKDRQPESVYEEEQKFWNGTMLTEDLPAWRSKEWKGFSKYIPARSVISSIPFVTNFNYGLGRFYNENGKRLSDNEWHNLSIQDILPTWQWHVDTTKAIINFDFTQSYTGGSSVKIETKKNIEKLVVPLYKTSLAIKNKEQVSLVAKGKGVLNLLLTTDDGNIHTYHIELSSEWEKTTHTLTKLNGQKVVKIALEITAAQEEVIHIGQLAVQDKRTHSVKSPEIEITPFIQGDSAELFVNIKGAETAAYHSIYQVNSDKKIWLASTKSLDYYVPEVRRDANAKSTTILVVSVAKDGSVSKASKSKMYWK